MTKCPKLENGTYVFGDGASGLTEMKDSHKNI